jgi:hypothetical protein
MIRTCIADAEPLRFAPSPLLNLDFAFLISTTPNSSEVKESPLATTFRAYDNMSRLARASIAHRIIFAQGQNHSRCVTKLCRGVPPQPQARHVSRPLTCHLWCVVLVLVRFCPRGVVTSRHICAMNSPFPFDFDWRVVR